MLKFFSLMLLLIPSLSAQAGDSDQDLLLAPTPPAQSMAETANLQHSQVKGLSLGLGTGFNSFGGNIGKLYSKSSPVAEVRGEWALSPEFSLRAGADFASYAFNAQPNGSVEVSTNSIQAAGQWHYISTAMTSVGFDPYASAGMAQTFRSQTFVSHNAVEKDNALAAGAGLGANYFLKDSKLGFWMEADASEVFFQDRHQQEYLESGITDMTGLLYSARLGVKYLF